MFQRAANLGYQQISSLGSATGLTLPVGPQLASATGCSLAGSVLTVGGTVTGAFAAGQVVKGTGIPANTFILNQTAANQWLLSNPCTTESGETVTAYQWLDVNFAVVRCTGQNVMWRDDGVAPTASTGMPLLTTDPPWEYAGDLLAIQFIQTAASAVLDVSYYTLVG